MEALLGLVVIASPIIFFYGLYVYNRSIRLEQYVFEEQHNLESFVLKVDNIFVNITSQLDLSSDFESELLKSISNIREGGINSISEVSNILSRALVRVEAYPNIDTINMRRDFQSQIQEVQNQLQDFVEKNNRAINEYNTFVMSFPIFIFCRLFGKRKIEYVNK